MRRREGAYGSRDRIDMQVWEAVCDAFPCDKSFTLADAVAICRRDVGAIKILPHDYAMGRVLGALTRVEATSFDIEQLPTPGEYTWILPSKKEEK